MPGVAPQPPGQSTSPPTAVSERPPAPRPLSVPPPAGLRSDEWRLGRATRETPAPAHEIARTQEIVRTRVFFLLATALAVIVLLLVPVLGGDPEAKRALVASLAPAALGSAWFAWALGNESHYSVDRTLFVGLLCLAAALGGIHYFGAFSLAVAVLPVGLFFFGTIGDGRAAAIAFVASASSYFVLVAAMLRGALVDRGLVATDLTPPQKVILAALVEIVLLLSFLNARTARATTQLALARQDRLVRGLAQRDEASAIPGLTWLDSSFKLEWMNDPWTDVERAGQWLLGVQKHFHADVIHLNTLCHGDLEWNAPVVI